METKGYQKTLSADNDYTGGAGNTEGTSKPMSYQDIYNATMKSARNELEEKGKDEIQQEGPKLLNHQKNMTTTRTESEETNRKLIPNKHNLSNMKSNMFGIMFDKKADIEHENKRNNTCILSALKDNPLVKPLNVGIPLTQKQ